MTTSRFMKRVCRLPRAISCSYLYWRFAFSSYAVVSTYANFYKKEAKHLDQRFPTVMCVCVCVCVWP